jgi:DNA-binding transcriptional MerR regulator
MKKMFNRFMVEEYYNINDLEKLTSIKAHTIRIWEKRYNLLDPKRTDTNIRYYTSEDLKKLLNISILNKNGLKISRIAELKEDEISEKVIELTTRNSDVEDQIQTLIMAMFNLNLQKFEKLLTVSYINRGFEKTYSEIISPFLTKIGFLWQAGTISPVQEHFASYIIRRKMVVAIDGILASYNEKSKHYVLFLPEGEQHEISLLYAYYLLKKNNQHVTYLGTSIPFGSIDELNLFHKYDYLVTTFTSAFSMERIKDYINLISDRFNDQQIIIFGPQIKLYNETLPSNLHKTLEIEDFVKFTTS